MCGVPVHSPSLAHCGLVRLPERLRHALRFAAEILLSQHHFPGLSSLQMSDDGLVLQPECLRSTSMPRIIQVHVIEGLTGEIKIGPRKLMPELWEGEMGQLKRASELRGSPGT